ncbi:hypothetical protein AB6D12_07690 [Vibrio cyclitrophicus]
MNQFRCLACDLVLRSHAALHQHELKCRDYLIQLKPSFKVEMSKKKKKARALIVGTYEWALSMPIPQKATKSMTAIDQKYSQIALEREVLRSERQIATAEVISDKTANRQIIVSHVLKRKIEKASKERAEHKQLLKQQKSNKVKTTKNKPQGSALGSSFDTKFSPFLSGGAPGLGKRA